LFYRVCSRVSVVRRRRLIFRLFGKRGQDYLQLFLDLPQFGRDNIERLLLTVDQLVKLIQLTLLMCQLHFQIGKPLRHHATSATAGERTQP